MGPKRTMLACVTSLALLAGGAASAVAQEDETSTGEMLEIFFVGDRLIADNDRLDSHFHKLLSADDMVSEFLTGSCVIADATLRQHYEQSLADDGDEDSGAIDMIREGDFDVVVLQGALFDPTEEAFAEYLEYAALFDEEIRARGGRTVLFMTWPPLTDGAQLDKMADFYRRAGVDPGATVAPVGLALANAQAERPEIRVVGLDPRLPSLAGTYAGAAVVYASIFERSPEGLAYWPSYLLGDDAAYLQEVAWRTVEEWRSED